jgi:hypothetical protein
MTLVQKSSIYLNYSHGTLSKILYPVFLLFFQETATIWEYIPEVIWIFSQGGKAQY